MTALLSGDLVERLLGRLPELTVAVLGDLFLDRYLDIDAGLTEPSLETGLDAYQVVRVRASPGATGTVINNLVSLGVGRVVPIALIGDDGEGHELRQALRALHVVELENVVAAPGRRTPTYTKPMLHVLGSAPRELNRLDFKNRAPLPAEAEGWVLEALAVVWKDCDALLVLDQVSEPDCGVVTARVRQRLAELAGGRVGRFVLADSRERIGLFRNVCLKPNERECLAALPGSRDVTTAARALAAAGACPAVFCTRGERGMLLATAESVEEVRAYPVEGPIDPVGAGDSTSAGIACAVAAGASLVEGAAFGNLVASITVRQLGTTGMASPADVRRRLREVGEIETD
jgi:rfaE bifunctional protein kinase chain/domain